MESVVNDLEPLEHCLTTEEKTTPTLKEKLQRESWINQVDEEISQMDLELNGHHMKFTSISSDRLLMWCTVLWTLVVLTALAFSL